MLFGCDDGYQYWVKDSWEGLHNRALVNEWLGSNLAKSLGIPIPDCTLVVIQDGSFDPSRLSFRPKSIIPGSIAFGSKNLDSAIDIADGILPLHEKRVFDLITNPSSLIEICLFDLWTSNSDRHSYNYNLVVTRAHEELTFYAIDHAQLFQGNDYSNILLEREEFSDATGSLYGTKVFQTITRLLDFSLRKRVSEEFCRKINETAEIDVLNILQEVPNEWNLNGNDRTNIIEFLLSRKDKIYPFCERQNILR